MFVAFLGQEGRAEAEQQKMVAPLSLFLVAGFLHSLRELHFYLSRTFPVCASENNSGVAACMRDAR